MIEFAIKKILDYLDDKNENYNFYGNEIDTISGFSSIKNYKNDTIAWIKNKESIPEDVNLFKIKLAVIPFEFEKFSEFNNCIKVDNPKNIFFSILNEFFKVESNKFENKYCCISENCNIDKTVQIGNFCTIEDNVIIGANTIIGNNVVVKRNVKIGDNCVIKSGTIIGEIGFGYSEDINGNQIRVPHYGSVEIGNNVDIGSNVTVERGTIDNTIICDNVKIDDLCQISHNVIIGERTNIIAGSYIYGSVTIGADTYIASSVIRNQINIGCNVVIGMGSVVTKNISDNNVVYGNPAKIKENK